ncbi:hypothetical protein W97_03693 [Coniosporium apollinis CBS 100218]|uniref:USP domain-containing protein n=1 Tax=Coniosporium apollinis (strain CBS 100218) TaxID=1168221 RepID=R7YS16_CONA1|nr:uncharacterized protein W97_03693 [Coniosporium apollinis CBS 100218]EON64461.1 hypothetical protein W97_03693 [Coniosporium apollinis CBS 100218]
MVSASDKPEPTTPRHDSIQMPKENPTSKPTPTTTIFQTQPSAADSPEPAFDESHSPVVIEIVDPEDGHRHDQYPPIMVLNNVDDTLEQHILRRFPFAEACSGNPHEAAAAILKHIADEQPLNPEFLEQITIWFADQLEVLEHRHFPWRRLYSDQLALWNDVGHAVLKLLHRHTDFGGEFARLPNERAQRAIQDLLGHYVRLCSRFVAIDAAALESTPQHEAAPTLMCHIHLRVLIIIILCSPKTNIWRHIQNSYSGHVEAICSSIAGEFLAPAVDGIGNLSKLIRVALPRINNCAGISFIVGQCFEVADRIGVLAVWSAEAEFRTSLPSPLGAYAKQAAELVQNVDGELHDTVARLNSGLPIDFRRDLALRPARLITHAMELDEHLARRLFAERIDSTRLEGKVELRHYPDLVSNVWKITFLMKYITKGRMDLRVLGVETLSRELVEVYKKFNRSPHNHLHPVLQYLAGILLESKVVDYMMGVNSHHQLISRSGNVIGFLAVTRRYTSRETDIIWDTITKGQDPGIVATTLQMLPTVTGLVEASELLYFCDKLSRLSPDAFNPDMVSFTRDLFEKIRNRRGDYATEGNSLLPHQVCMRLIRETCALETTDAHAVFEMATHELLLFSQLMANADDRRTICKDCAQSVKDQMKDATGSIRILLTMVRLMPEQDMDFLAQELDLTQHLIKEFCSYVDNGRHLGPSVSQNTGMNVRLELLLSYFVRCRPQTIPENLYGSFWDHLVGKDALRNDLRDAAWQFLSDIHRQPGVHNQFLDWCIANRLTTVEPEHFSQVFYQFVTQLTQHQIRTELQVSDDGVIQIPSHELLWKMVLTAPDNTIEFHTAKFLATTYLDPVLRKHVGLAVMEASHTAVVNLCMQQLASTFAARRALASSAPCSNASDHPLESLPQSNTKETAPESTSIEATELHFTRTLLFLKTLLTHVRINPDYSLPKALTAGAVASSFDELPGNVVDLRYQAFDGGPSELKTIQVGDLETHLSIYRRLQSLTGFAEFTVISGGQWLDLRTEPSPTLHDSAIHTKGALLVKKTAGGEEVKVPSLREESVIERGIKSHFDQLYSFMDSGDKLSSSTYSFLQVVYPNNKPLESGATGGVSLQQAFVYGKPFQTRFTVSALTDQLQSQLRTGPADVEFLAQGVRLLSSAVVDERLISGALDTAHDLEIAQSVTQSLVGFLKERPPKDISNSYFADSSMANRLAARLIQLLRASLDSSTAVSLALNCYSAMLESCMHSRLMCDAFLHSQDFRELHHRLLLTDTRVALRRGVARLVEANCGQLPDTAPIATTEAVSFYWSTLRPILRHATGHAKNSLQLFTAAEFVFSRTETQGEQELREYIQEWGGQLLQFRHNERVGREAVDEVVLGFTKLLTHCVRRLKSQLKSPKRQIDVGTLMDQIFATFLFPSGSPSRTPGEADSLIQLPVLNPQTRRALYDLVLDLCNDDASLGKLVTRTASLIPDEFDLSFDVYLYDRTKELRASNGHVGIVNLGASCYMNSLLVQLYMNVPFREAILRAKSEQPLLVQTQRLFAYMQDGFGRAVNARDLARCIRIDGQFIDTSKQMDTEEFYSGLMDQWEFAMPSTDARENLRGFYGGQIIHQTKSRDCDHVSETTEPFNRIQCVVQGKATLQDSLKSYVEGDVLEGDNKYKCERCDGRLVDAVRRTCLKEIPDNLIFSLKRFDVNPLTWERCKVNDRFEFPQAIDMSQYKLEHLSDPGTPVAEDMFELVGALVHTGSIDSGHYFSYIRVRPGASPETWLEFNDDIVREFDPKFIPDLCYGGYSDETDMQKHWNAYMLFYQRKSTIEAGSTGATGEVTVPIPANLEFEIAADNARQLRDYCLFEPSHAAFVRQVLQKLRTVTNGACSEEHELENETIAMVMEHLNLVVARTKGIPEFENTMMILRRTVKGCVDCCNAVMEWLDDHPYALRNLLLVSTQLAVREDFGAFIVEMLVFLRAKAPSLYGSEVSEADSDNDQCDPDNGALAHISAQLAELLEGHLHINARAWDDFFGLLNSIAAMGSRETVTLVDKGCFTGCLRILSIPLMPNVMKDADDFVRMFEKRRPRFDQLTRFFHRMVSALDLHQLRDDEENLLGLWYEDKKERCLPHIYKILEEWNAAERAFIPGEIIKHYLEADSTLKLSPLLCQTIMSGIENFAPNFVDNFLTAGLHFCYHCHDIKQASAVINAAAQNTRSLGTEGGAAHLDFFRTLFRIKNEHLDDQSGLGPLYRCVVQYAPTWLPGLLMYADIDIRSATMELLHFQILNRRIPPNPDADDMVRAAAVRQFLKNGRNWILQGMSANSSKKHLVDLFNGVMSAMEWFRELVEGDENPCSRPEDEDLLEWTEGLRDDFKAYVGPDDEMPGSGMSLFF